MTPRLFVRQSERLTMFVWLTSTGIERSCHNHNKYKRNVPRDVAVLLRVQEEHLKDCPGILLSNLLQSVS